MRIRNEYEEEILWRAFKADDTAYVVGLKQGAIDRGKIGDWREDSFDTIKLEIKTGDIVFPKKILVSAGERFRMTDDLVVTKSGKLEAALVKLIANRGQQTVRRYDIQIIDARGRSGDHSRVVSSKVSTAAADTETMEKNASHEQTWSAGGQFGGTLGKEDVAGVNAGLSFGFEDKVVNSLRTSNERSLSRLWEKGIEDTMTFSPGKIHVVEFVWSLTLDRGRADYFGENANYSVVVSAEPELVKTTAYDSPQQLPPRYLRRWNALDREH